MMLKGRCIIPGRARGDLLVTSQPISFWGGVDPQTGRISDPRHELFNQSITAKILAFPYGKGSSTGSLMILELLRTDKAPAAIINIRTEPILATGPIVGRYFYGKTIPIITIKKTDFMCLTSGVPAEIDGAAGTLTRLP